MKFVVTSNHSSYDSIQHSLAGRALMVTPEGVSHMVAPPPFLFSKKKNMSIISRSIVNLSTDHQYLKVLLIPPHIFEVKYEKIYFSNYFVLLITKLLNFDI